MINSAMLLGAMRARLQRFAHDKRGAIAILFALAVLPLIFLVGLAVDFRSLQISKSNMQNALDSAILAAARTYTSNASLPDGERETLASAAGQAMWDSNLLDSGPELDNKHINFTYTKELQRVQAVGTADAPTAFGGLAGVDLVRIQVNGTARGADPRRVEVVLALDTTGSMFENDRFILMRGAAMNFVEKLFVEQSQPNKLYVGVVPWTTTVNINMERPDSTWSSSGSVTPATGFDGTRVVPPAAFQDFRSYVSFPENHILLTEHGAPWSTYGAVAFNSGNAEHVLAWNAMFAPTTWRGCIRAAPLERRTNSGGTVLAALTDSPPATMRWQADAVEPTLQMYGTSSPNSTRLRCGSTSSTNQNNSGYNPYFDKPNRPCYTTSSASSQTVAYTTTSPNSYRAVCMSDAYEFSYLATHQTCPFKTVAIPHAYYNNPWLSGPNVNCPSSMLGLSGNKVQVLNTLNRMYANSDGTQQDLGLMWGLRMLSPNAAWKTFFGTNGNNAPFAYDTDTVRKVLVLLTDGDNNVPTRWEGYYGCSTTSATTRGNGNTNGSGACWKSADIAGTLNDAKLDALTRDACEAVRDDYDIELYTIAVDVTNQTAIDLLEECAGDSSRAFNITAGEINATFLEIANQTLRLTE